MDSNTPLLQGNSSSSSSSNVRKQWYGIDRTNCVRGIVGCTATLAVLVVVALLVMVGTGTFGKVHHSSPRRINETFVEEPNTGYAFPLHIPGPQVLIGVDLWADTAIGIMHFDLAAVALWISSNAIARQRLLMFREHKTVSEHLKDALTRPGLTQTMELRMARKQNKKTLIKRVLNDLHPYLSRYCEDDEEAEEQKQILKQVLEQNEYTKGFTFSFERRAIDDALFASIGQHKPNKPLVKKRIRGTKGCLAKSMWRQKLDTLGNGLTKLLNNVFTGLSDVTVVSQEVLAANEEGVM